MTQPNSIPAHLRLIGRCALSGLLAGFLATQTFAETAPITQEHPSMPLTTGLSDPVPMDSALPAPFMTNTAPKILWNAPATSESASAVTPANLHLMLDDANQAAQALSTAPSNQKRIQRPGMLVLGIAGVPLMIFGAYVYSLHTSGSKASSLKAEYGTAFLVPGAAMSGLGFYFAFHKKH